MFKDRMKGAGPNDMPRPALDALITKQRAPPANSHTSGFEVTMFPVLLQAEGTARKLTHFRL